jgi:5S rRNA maturation endonuclease (ribonuclease M5)
MAPNPDGSDDPAALAVVESGIDAVAFAAANPGIMAVSTGGSGSKALIESIHDYAKSQRVPLLWAGDRDRGGEILRERIEEVAGPMATRQAQIGYKDWGEQARAHRQHQGAPTPRATPKGPGL